MKNVKVRQDLHFWAGRLGWPVGPLYYSWKHFDSLSLSFSLSHLYPDGYCAPTKRAAAAAPDAPSNTPLDTPDPSDDDDKDDSDDESSRLGTENLKKSHRHRRLEWKKQVFTIGRLMQMFRKKFFPEPATFPPFSPTFLLFLSF